MGRKFKIASKQTDSLRENAFINIGQKYELQLFCIIDRDRANGCQESSVSKNSTKDDDSSSKQTCFRIDKWLQKKIQRLKISRRDTNYKILEDGDESLLQRRHFPRSSSINSKANRIEAHPLSLGQASREEEVTMMANKPLRTFLLNISTHFDLAIPSSLDLP